LSDAPAKAAHPPIAGDVPGAESGDVSPSDLDRRTLMKLFAAGAALAGGGLAGCMERPRERIMPRVEQPPEMTPGVPLTYATSMVIDGFATGLVAHAREGRPIKMEGNPDHPASLGGTSAIHQASILDLYDPARSSGALERGLPRATETLLGPLSRRSPLPGLWFLLHPQSSPLVEQLMARVRERHPGATFAYHAPVDRRSVYEGARLAFGRPLEAQYRFERADVVVSLDADFLAAMPNSVRWSRDFAARRRIASPAGDPGRLYVAETAMTPTGTLADHRLPVRPSQIARLAAALAAELARLGIHTGAPGAIGTALAGRAAGQPERAWATAAARDLAAHRGRGLVLAGDHHAPAVHALVHAINAALTNFDRTVWFTRPALLDPLGPDLGDVVAAARAGAIETLVIVEANPAYSGPADLDIRSALTRVPSSICVSAHRDETAAACGRMLPLAHYLETWGDARSYDGTLSLVQPLIRPLYDGVSLADVLAVLAGDPRPDSYRRLRELHGAPVGAGPELERVWQSHLQRGFLPGTAASAETVQLSWSPAMAAAVADAAAAPAGEPGLELRFAPSQSIYDGRFASNAWLQELPRPITKLTWDSAALIGAGTARRAGVSTGDVVRLTVEGRSLEAPVLVAPGHAEGAVTLELGYGRRQPVAASGTGVDAYALRTSAGLAFAGGLRLARTGAHRRLAVTQASLDPAGRAIALHTTVAAYRRDPDFTAEHRGPLPNLLPERAADRPQWGMTIDTSICSGCSACVTACQAENNIPIVGRDGVLAHREMHWLRIDSYEVAPARVVHQPMLCQHCERAPCEYVCPTYATQHSPDGLNEMVYNRCIGTRFCSNNCPYKVRRFNWFDYTEDAPRPVQLQRNPDVTVRARGVMEKCTYCVQRIRRAEIAARMEEREIGPGEVVTACQQACPTGAIRFGPLHHADTPVVAWRRELRAYEVLHELGTRPRTIYLAAIANPNPELT
jgi:Fe-S-cluster-containing dehydrogenase component/anaerobic selenocysteine-containing dehydrogenase